jgi:hypothetical protein
VNHDQAEWKGLHGEPHPCKRSPGLASAVGATPGNRRRRTGSSRDRCSRSARARRSRRSGSPRSRNRHSGSHSAASWSPHMRRWAGRCPRGSRRRHSRPSVLRRATRTRARGRDDPSGTDLERRSLVEAHLPSTVAVSPDRGPVRHRPAPGDQGHGVGEPRDFELVDRHGSTGLAFEPGPEGVPRPSASAATELHEVIGDQAPQPSPLA